ncbi:MAG: BspA family leucine-rich repeat surface protein [Prevotella sp.]|nr:BspA family leucine-rich repeat surface protein [Prevotella sp.]
MKKRLLTIIFAFAALASWAQTVVVDITSPEFSFEGDNLVMTTETANASIFYGIAELSDLTDEVVTATTNSLVQLNTYYTQPIEIKSNVVVKAIAVSDEGGTTVQSDTTILAYGYTLWVELQTAMDRGNTVYAKANGNTAVDSQLLSDLQWAIEEGEMMMNARGSAPYFEAEHFAQTINDLCDQIEAIIGTDEPYAVLSDNNTVLTFYYDDQKTARGGMSVGPFSHYQEMEWNSVKGVINTVTFDTSFADYLPTSTDYWFDGMYLLNTIVGIENLHTQNVTSMKWMFDSCSSLTSLDLSHFNTENVTNMDNMFWGMSQLTELKLDNFNTEKVTSMDYMFAGCTKLQALDLSSFNTAAVEVMSGMFNGCAALTTLDLSGFNTENVTNTDNMFKDCSSLAAIQAGNANIPAIEYNKIDNPNLLVYVNDASLVPGGIQNVVVNGVASEIVLMDADAGNNNWYCPQPFTAQKISYTRNFQQQTQIGVSRGWETIALPFDVQTVAAEDTRVITPFGDDSSSYHFWLRRLTSNGLQSVTQIEANTPYLISMPNSTEYPEEYKLAGKVTFSAENASVPESNLVFDESADFFMAPVFESLEAQQHIYALNVGEERAGHPEGSVFEQNYRELRPFEAFTKHLSNGGARFLSIEDMLDGGVTGIEELKNGRIEGLKSESWYDLNGRRVLYPTKGVYIKNGRKVVIK